MSSDGRRKAALVTGASGGIGAATTLALARDGWDVAIQYRSNEGRATEIAAEASSLGARAIVVRCDVADPREVAQMISGVNQSLGAITGLVHAAGFCHRARLGSQSDEEWAVTVAVNLTALFVLAKAVEPVMRECGGGSIVTIASIAGITGGTMGPAYAASKGGVISLTRYLASELRRHGIRVNAVAPTLTATPMLERLAIPEAVGQLPAGRAATPSEVAEVAAFLLSDRASYVSGETVQMTG